MLLLNTLPGFGLLQISAVPVPSLDKVAPYFKFDSCSNGSPLIGNCVVSAVHRDHGPFYADFHAVRPDTCNQSVCQILLLPIRSMSSAKRRLQTDLPPIEIVVWPVL